MLKMKKANPINDMLTAVDAARDRIAELQAARSRIAEAPRPVAETMAAFDFWLARAATEAVDRLNIYEMTERNAAGALRLPLWERDGAITDTRPAVEVLLGLLAAVAGERLRAIVQGQIEDLAAARPGLSEKDRNARLQDLDREILTAELREEYAVRQLAGQGVSIQRRADASPLAVLAADNALTM